MTRIDAGIDTLVNASVNALVNASVNALVNASIDARSTPRSTGRPGAGAPASIWC